VSERLSILQVNTRDAGGGAEHVARRLFEAYRAMGHRSHLAVGYKSSTDPDVSQIVQGTGESLHRRIAWGIFQVLQPWYGRSGATRRLCRVAHNWASPRRQVDRRQGLEDFDYPGSRSVAGVAPFTPDILHLHNLHGSYFDLRALPELSRRHPTVVTLHDAWLLSGHCAHSFDCDRWVTGCGSCPDLTIYPAVAADATAENWNRKRDLYLRSRLHVATPCQWLMSRVRRSMLAPAIASSRVIPYGIDLNVFYPGDRGRARDAVGLPREADVLLFAANGIRHNPFKDYETMRAAVARLGDRSRRRKLLLVALGEHAHEERIGSAAVRFVPFTSDPKRVACYYQAADVYLHAARADTFPNVVLEALACGCGVVATAVGGISEQVKSLDLAVASEHATRYATASATGVLVDRGDDAAMACAVERLLGDASLRRVLQENAAVDARRRFDLKRHARDYLGWYREILGVTTSVERSLLVLAERGVAPACTVPV